MPIRLQLCWMVLLCATLCGAGMMPIAAAQETRASTREPVFLVAAPELGDPNFAHTVVLVAFPEDGGPIGVILNRPTPFTLAKLFPDEPKLKRRSDPVSFGGPVKLQALMFLFRSERATDGAVAIMEDLYLSGNADVLDKLLQRPGDGFVRYYVGYAGWAPGQLEAEIALGGWYVVPADVETIVNADPKRIWKQLLLRATAVKT
jgi:putative transcriptional regulator